MADTSSDINFCQQISDSMDVKTVNRLEALKVEGVRSGELAGSDN